MGRLTGVENGDSARKQWKNSSAVGTEGSLMPFLFNPVIGVQAEETMSAKEFKYGTLCFLCLQMLQHVSFLSK